MYGSGYLFCIDCVKWTIWYLRLRILRLLGIYVEQIQRVEFNFYWEPTLKPKKLPINQWNNPIDEWDECKEI